MEETTQQPDIYFPELDNNNNTGITKKIIIIATVLSVLYILFLVFLNSSPKTTEPDFIKKQTDSLAKANVELQAKQASLDSLSKVYESKIEELDWKINNIGEKKVVIREYYHEKTKQPESYTQKQVDSFFKDRYKY